MNVIAMFVLGLLIGWLVEWVIDWSYWRGRIYSIASENTNLKALITSLEAEKNKKSPSAETTPITDEAGKDNLQAIKGIGPVFSKRLNEAGIYTFEQLSQLTSKELEEILGQLFKRFFSKEETIIAQAKEFAQQKAQKG
jgi:predicted flap endonuclease-1-like 5' DNA nuclease